MLMNSALLISHDLIVRICNIFTSFLILKQWYVNKRNLAVRGRPIVEPGPLS